MQGRRTPHHTHAQCETLESRTLLCAAHCSHEITPVGDATHRAVADGVWSDPATWQEGHVPGDGARIAIDEGLRVTVDGLYESIDLQWIRVAGELNFQTDVNTSLLVETIVVTPTGNLVVGSESDPVQSGVTARVTFADHGPLNLHHDRELIGRGLVVMGRTSIWGQAKTNYATLAQPALAGSDELVFDHLPDNWQVGDSIVVSGTGYGRSFDEIEERIIAAIDGNTATLDEPLEFSHRVYEDDRDVYVANTTRNIVFESENATDASRRGHIVFLHTNAADVNYASFVNLGRTDKSLPRDDVRYDEHGHPIAGSGTNPVARYPLHFHRAGSSTDGIPGRVRGVSVEGTIGWGIVNHSSHVLIEDNVIYDGRGAGYVTEAGDETGTFERNIAIGIRFGMLPNRARAMESEHLGTGGEAYWFQGPGVLVQDNIAANSETGFVYFPVGLQEGRGEAGTMTFRGENLGEVLSDPRVPAAAGAPAPDSFAGQSIPVGAVPIRFFGNVAANVERGLDYWHNIAPVEGYRNIIQDFTAWDVEKQGIKLYRAQQIDIVDVDLSGTWTPYDPALPDPGELDNTASTGIWARRPDDLDLQYINPTITDFSIGIDSGNRSGTFRLVGGFLDNVADVGQHGFDLPNSQLVIEGDPTFGTSYDGDDGHDIFVRLNREDRTISDAIRTTGGGSGLPALFSDQPSTLSWHRLGRIILDGQEYYHPEQARDFIPFPATSAANGIPEELLNLTNEQLLNDFGLAIGGRLAPADAVPHENVRGVVGNNVETISQPVLLSERVASVRDYRLRYRDLDGRTIEEQDAIPLHDGWNLIMRPMNRTVRSFLVFGETIEDRQAVRLSFDESAGVVADDSTGHGNDGHLQNGAAFSGQGTVIFDGHDDVVSLADSRDVNVAIVGKRTIAVRFRADDAETDRVQVLYEEGGTWRGLAMYLFDGRVYVGAWDRGAGWSGTWLSAHVTSDEWHTVTVVLNAGERMRAGGLRGYLDGKQFASGYARRVDWHTDDVAIGNVAGRSRFHNGIGRTGNHGFAGQISDVSVDNRVLSDAEIEQYGPDAPNPSHMVLQLRFDQANRNRADDVTGRRNHGHLRNGATINDNGAVVFDGDDDLVAVLDSRDLNTAEVTAKRTISVRFRADDVSISDRHQVLYEEGGAWRGMSIYLHDGKVYVAAWDRGYGWNGTFLSTTVESGKWHTVTLVLDTRYYLQDDVLRGYLDGRQFASGRARFVETHTGDIGVGNVNGQTRFHDGVGGNQQGFAGHIDNVRIDNRAMRDDEIDNLSFPFLANVE